MTPRRIVRFSLAFLFTATFAPGSWSADAEPAAESVAAPPAEIAFRKGIELTDNDRVIITAFVEHAVGFADKLTAEKVAEKCLKGPEMFAWVDFPSLNCLNLAYELTGDTKYLDRFREGFELYRAILTKGPDEFLGWYGSPIPARIPKDNPEIRIDEIQMNFRAISILSKWVELARSNPEYAASRADTLQTYTNLMEKHLYPKWDARGFFAVIEGRGGVYHGLDYPIEGGTTLSHEKLSIMVDGLLGLHRVTGNDLYLRRALEVGAWFKSCLMLPNGHYEWMSWYPAGPWDVSKDKPDAWKIGWIAPDPNGPWYVASLSIALNLYQHGLLFTDDDLQRFVRTQKEMCWNGDWEKPEYRTVAGTTGKYVKGRFLSDQLAHYDPELTKLAFYGPHEAEALANIGSDWKGGTNAQDYVWEKYLMQAVVKAKPRPYAEYGERFLAKPENREFYEKLNRPVVAPGAVKPTTPSAMGL